MTEEDRERVIERADERRRARTESVEEMSNRAAELLGEHKYPTTSEELATEYADEPLGLPNETESLGSVFDRLVDERYESPDEAREALYNELTGEADGTTEYNDQRALEDLDESAADDVADSGASDR